MKNITLGFCPTMKVFVNEIINTRSNVSAINLGSAARVLYALSNNDINVGLVGRRAKKSEFSGYEQELNNKQGYTLVSAQKSFVREGDLKNLRVVTSIDKEIVETNFPQLQNVIFDNQLNDKLTESEVRLISWTEWNDDFNLLIPVDDFGNKMLAFRKPYLFSKNKELIEDVLRQQ